MTRQESLHYWPMTVMGGPALKSTNDAIRFASLAYDNLGALSDLLAQRVRLMHRYYVLKDDKKDNLELMADIAFKVQFSHDAMLQVVKLRHAASNDSVSYNQIDSVCPFCSEDFIEHNESGHCPGYAIDPDLSLVF